MTFISIQTYDDCNWYWSADDLGGFGYNLCFDEWDDDDDCQYADWMMIENDFVDWSWQLELSMIGAQGGQGDMIYVSMSALLSSKILLIEFDNRNCWWLPHRTGCHPDSWMWCLVTTSETDHWGLHSTIPFSSAFTQDNSNKIDVEILL